MAKDENMVQDDYSADELIIRKKKAPEMKEGVTAESVLAGAAQALEAVRAKGPLVHCMTNVVAANFTANALLAFGVQPAMVEDVGEVSQFSAIADAVLVNLGTVTKPQGDAMRAAVSHANMGGRPWVLDPVAVGALLPLRTFLAKELMRRFPAVIRGNASEIAYLAGNEKVASRGVSAAVTSDEVAPLVGRLAAVTHAAVLVTGAVDYVALEGAPLVAIENGTPLMTRVTGVGCVQGALVAAFLGALGGKARWEAALAAALVTAIAGEMAAEKAATPGRFQTAFLDALDAITPQDVLTRGRVQIRAS